VLDHECGLPPGAIEGRGSSDGSYATGQLSCRLGGHGHLLGQPANAGLPVGAGISWGPSRRGARANTVSSSSINLHLSRTCDASSVAPIAAR
jgi:hypothetical protein